MKPVALCLILCCIFNAGLSQQYIIYFKDKKDTPHGVAQPKTFLSQKAVDRRSRYSIAVDSSDLPVSPHYIDSLRSIAGVVVLNTSRWMNAVSVQVLDQQTLQQLQRFPFVVKTERAGSRLAAGRRKKKLLPGSVEASSKPYTTTGTFIEPFRYGRSEPQIALHNGDFLHNIGLHGEGMTIGFLDAGFYRYNSLPAFDSAIAAGRILSTWDFVARDTNVAEDDAHGMQCFSIVAANIPGTLVGTAPMASFHLFRSEDASSEKVIEEFNWVCAAERLDSAGGDIISSSLGYTEFDNGIGNHSYASLDGNTTVSVRGADIAAQKGILVVNAAGNSGDDQWQYISTPADGDSVLAVGAVDARGTVGSFSSYGPAPDGRIKPDVASVGVGTFVQATNGRITSGDGTSFATPNMAGLAACLWQGFPELSNMQIIDVLKQSGNRFMSPDAQLGYGVPDMKKAVSILTKRTATIEAKNEGCRMSLTWQSKDMNAMKYVIERRLPGQTTFAVADSQNGTGPAFGAHSYTWSQDVTEASGGITEYRILQMLDTTTRNQFAFYLDTVSITLPQSCGFSNRFRVVPNPASGSFVVEALFNEPIATLRLAVINNAGQQLALIQQAKPAGTTRIPVQSNGWAAGQYYIQVFDAEQRLGTLPFVKL